MKQRHALLTTALLTAVTGASLISITRPVEAAPVGIEHWCEFPLKPSVRLPENRCHEPATGSHAKHGGAYTS